MTDKPSFAFRYSEFILPAGRSRNLEAFVADYNHLRYHECIANLTLADVYFGRRTILIERERERERVKRQTIANRRLLHRRQVT